MPHTLWSGVSAENARAIFWLRWLLRGGKERAICFIDVLRACGWRSAAGGWCGVEGVWDECGLLPALQSRVPTRLSRCGFVVGDIPAVRCDVHRQQRVGGAKGGCVLLRPAGCFVCGRSLVCADAWEKHPPWLLLVVAVAVCSRCTVLPSPVPCVCVRELLLLGVAAAGMMMPPKVDGWLCSLSCLFAWHASFSLYFFTNTRENKRESLL
ncbi:trans-sialidase [Trypanosoma cruzi cruzi]|nr:trans-sialidase [Trypanosoma cruzi cruzi]